MPDHTTYSVAFDTRFERGHDHSLVQPVGAAERVLAGRWVLAHPLASVGHLSFHRNTHRAHCGFDRAHGVAGQGYSRFAAGEAVVDSRIAVEHRIDQDPPVAY